MSGPKISVYSLTGRAREIVNGQIRCEQESVICASTIESILKKCDMFYSSTDRLRKNIQLLIRRTSKGSEQLHELQRIEEMIERESKQIKESFVSQKPTISEKYQITEEAYAEKKEQIKKLKALKERATKLLRKIEKFEQRDKENISSVQNSILYYANVEQNETIPQADSDFLPNIDAKNTESIQKSILSDLSGFYSFEFDSERTENELHEEKEKTIRYLQELLATTTLPPNLIAEINNAILFIERINDKSQLASFKLITVKGIQKRIDEYYFEQKKLREKLEEERSRYRLLCEMSGEKCQSIFLSEESITIISKENKRLEELVNQQREQSYISDCVDEVMTDMGYSVLGSREVTKRNGKRFRNELFTYGEGTAVNVTYSPNGRIAMELGGLDSTDRTPTVSESAVLCSEMKQFCTDFKEIEKRLLAKGVMVANRISLLPPTEAHAMIINTADYEMQAKAEHFSAEEHRRRAAEKKTMRVE